MREMIKAMIANILRQTPFLRNIVLRDFANNGIFFGKDFGSYRVLFHPQDHIGRVLQNRGVFEIERQREVVNLLNDLDKSLTNMTVLEVGANIGTQM